MGCCKGGLPIDQVYVPLYERLIEYGKGEYGKELMERFPKTCLWLFTFYEDTELCQECGSKLSEMGAWFNEYGLFDKVESHVKWVVDDSIKNNLILADLNIQKTPIHFFCAHDGKIIDIVYGFPTSSWLKKYILPVIRKPGY